MNTFPIVAVSSSLVSEPRHRLHIFQDDVDAGVLAIRIFKSRHGKGCPTYHIYRGDEVLFTGKIGDIRTIVSSRQIDYTLTGGKLSGYHIFTSAVIAVPTV